MFCCCWIQSAKSHLGWNLFKTSVGHVLLTLTVHYLKAMDFPLEWQRRRICFFTTLSDKSRSPANVYWLTVHCQLSISWWLYTSDIYETMDDTYISKQNGGHSNRSRLLLLLLLAGNASIFLLTKIPAKESNFSCAKMKYVRANINGCQENQYYCVTRKLPELCIYFL